MIFKAEQTLFNATVDYTSALDPIASEERAFKITHGAAPVDERMLALKKVMPPKEYKKLSARAERSAEALELEALKGAQAFPGAGTALQAAKSAGWGVVVTSDFGKKPVSEWLELVSLDGSVDLVSARSRLDTRNGLKRSLTMAKRKLKGLDTPVYFCNSSREAREAKSLGVKCFVLPSKTEPFPVLFMAKPDGLLLSLEELPQMMSLPSMQLHEPAPATSESSGVPVAAPES